ncbi:MAG: hypothetical protein Q8P81_03670 [Nanoarchaeota archaeon]|nr:hypothetical protein [Nanoarchaeota archaeon]
MENVFTAKSTETKKKNRPSNLVYKCSYCGQQGHNKAKCPTRLAQASQEKVISE